MFSGKQQLTTEKDICLLVGKIRFLRHFFSRLQLAVDQQREQAVQECVNAGVPVEVSFAILFWFSKMATSRCLLSF